MKHHLLFGLLLTLLSACRDPAPDPTLVSGPAIALHITANSPGIAPTFGILVNARRMRRGQVQEEYQVKPYVQDQVDDTRVIIPALDPAHTADSLYVSVGLPGPYAGFYDRTGFAQIEVLVNGQVRKTVRVDESTPMLGRSPYQIQEAYLSLRGL